MQNPAWNIESEYPHLDSPEFLADFGKVEQSQKSLQSMMNDLQGLFPKANSETLDKAESARLLKSLHQMAEIKATSDVLLHNLMTYTHCELSVDGTLEKAKKVSSQLGQLRTQNEETLKPLSLLLVHCSEGFF